MIIISVIHFYFLSLDLCFQINSEKDEIYKNVFVIWSRTILQFFLFDMLHKFNAGFFIQGAIVLDQNRIINKYLKSEFLLDLFSFTSLLFTSICFEYNNLGYFFNLVFVFKYPVIKTLLQRIEEIINFNKRFEAFINILKLFVKMLFLAHFVACIWLNLASFSSKELNWMSVKGIENESILLKYELSLYWAFVTLATIGYGDITPQNSYEYLFSIIVVVLGSMFFGYSLSSIAGIFKELEKEKLIKKYFCLYFQVKLIYSLVIT